MITESFIEIPGSPLAGENPLPVFRSPNRDKPCVSDGSLLPEELDLLGYEAGFRVLPYRMQDRYGRERSPLKIKTIVLENDFIRAEFLPEYGGRLRSLRDVAAGEEILYTNPVFQPANLAIRNAWFSGGIEWNVSQFGHTYTTCSPVFCGLCLDADGREFLRIYEFEREKQLFWQIDAHLPPDSRCLLVHVRIINDDAFSKPMYWWTNIAVKEEKDCRVFSESDEVIYINPETLNIGSGGFGHGKLPGLPTLKGVDASFPCNSLYANEYFFQNSALEESPWEAVAYRSGTLVYERSTQPLLYRKMFCWGTHAGGRKWRDFLSEPVHGDYFEIQAGLSRSQVHGMNMRADSVISFTQVFGRTDASPRRTIDAGWPEAKDAVRKAVQSAMPASRVRQIHAELEACALNPIRRMLHEGSGWGALEKRFREVHDSRALPAGLEFSASTLGREQAPWQALLETGVLPPFPAQASPASWMTEKKWLAELGKSLETPAARTAGALLHYGVMLYENGLADDAFSAWRESLEKEPSPWALRNLGFAFMQGGDTSSACEQYRKAFELWGDSLDPAFAEEYLKLLSDSCRWDEAWSLVESLSPQTAAGDRIRMLTGIIAFHRKQYDLVELALSADYSVIKEGETTLTDLWYLNEARKLAEAMPGSSFAAQLDRARASLKPPARIDFRLLDEL